MDGQALFRRIYSTPIECLYEEERSDPTVGQWHGGWSWKSMLPWVTSRLIKGPEDYRVPKYIVEHTEYVADYFPLDQAIEWLGREGVVLDSLPHSPMQMLLINWVGSEEGRTALKRARGSTSCGDHTMTGRAPTVYWAIGPRPRGTGVPHARPAAASSTGPCGTNLGADQSWGGGGPWPVHTDLFCFPLHFFRVRGKKRPLISHDGRKL